MILYGIISQTVGCVLSQLKLSELYILNGKKGLGLWPRTFSTANNVELLGLYPIHISLKITNLTFRSVTEILSGSALGSVLGSEFPTLAYSASEV